MNEEEQKYFNGLIGFTFDSDDIKYIEKVVDKKDKEIERLNNIINELEQYTGEDDWTSVNGEIAIRLVKLKLQELKGSDDK